MISTHNHVEMAASLVGPGQFAVTLLPPTRASNSVTARRPQRADSASSSWYWPAASWSQATKQRSFRQGTAGDPVGPGRYSQEHAADSCGAGHPGRGAGADHLRQRGHRLYRGPGGHRPVRRPADGGRSALGAQPGEPAAAGPLDQPSPVRSPVPGRDLRHRPAGDDPGDPPLPRLEADQGIGPKMAERIVDHFGQAT